MRAPLSAPSTPVRGARTITVQKPAAGNSDDFRVGPGDTLDFSKITAENITLVKLGNRLIVLFPDKSFVVIDGLYLADGTPSQNVHVGLDASTSLDGPQFVAQFPISTDEQILTAAGISLGPRGSGGINLAAAPPGSALSILSDLTPDTNGPGATFDPLNPSSFGARNTLGITNPPTPGAATPLPPVASGDAGAVSEAGVNPGNTPFSGVPGANGNVLTNDTTLSTITVTGVAAGLAASISGNVGATIAGTYGSVLVLADGTYTYALDNLDLDTQHLAQGASAQEVFTYTITDAFGQTSTAQLVITLTGTNDAPVITSSAAAATGAVTEDSSAAPTATGTLTAGDVDNGAVLSWSGNAAGSYGSFAINPATGAWTYTLDNSLADPLTAAGPATETFTVTLTDEFGATATQLVTITVNGIDDPVPVTGVTLDLDTTIAGVDYQGLSAIEAARSTPSSEGLAGVPIVQTDDAQPGPITAFVGVTTTGALIDTIHVEIAPTASGNPGLLRAPFIAVSGPYSTSAAQGTAIDVTSTGGGFTPADVESLMAAFRYFNTEQTFALDIADRVINVTITDGLGNTASAIAHVPVIADVRDTTGLDVFTGTRFDDRIDGMTGSDTIHAGAGNDTIIYHAGDGTDVLLDGGDGIDTLELRGSEFPADDIFRVQTSGGALTHLTSGAGVFSLSSNLANIELVVLNGLAGAHDLLSYEGNQEAVSVDLAAGTATGFQSITNIEDITGGARDDVLRGDANGNIIFGGDGDDIIDGRGGDNTLDGGNGDDTITAGAGNDTIHGGDGSDTINSGGGVDTIFGDAGDDAITAETATIDGGSGDDTITVTLAGTIHGGLDDDTITTGTGFSTVYGDAGDDTIVVGSGGAQVFGGADDDTITTTSGGGELFGGTGHDTYHLGSGVDLVHFASVLTEGGDDVDGFTSGTDFFVFDAGDVGNGLATGGTDTGTLDGSRFVAGAAFTSGDQRFLFNTADNTLYYDADGSGAGAGAIALAHLENGTVTATDIRIA